MLWIIAAVLAVLWILGMLTSTTIGGFIHVLIVIAIVVVAVNLIRGKKKVSKSAQSSSKQT
jgi:uncharacterized membrane protein YciS (DUF1049 family)